MGYAEIVPSEICSLCNVRRELAKGRWRYDPRLGKRWACEQCK